MEYHLWFLYSNILVSSCIWMFLSIFCWSWPLLLVPWHYNHNPCWMDWWSLWVKENICEENPLTNSWQLSCLLGEEITKIASSWYLPTQYCFPRWIAWIPSHVLLHGTYISRTMEKNPSCHLEWHTYVEIS